MIPRPLISPCLSAAVWRQFFDACRTHGVKSACVPLVLQLLASPEGVPSSELDRSDLDVAAMNRWKRRKGWVTASLLRGRRGMGPEVVYGASADLRAAFDLPPVLAARLRDRITGWLAALHAAHIDRAPIRLLAILVYLAEQHADASAGLARRSLVSRPFMECRGHLSCAADLRLLTRLGLLAMNGQRYSKNYLGAWTITRAGRRVLALPQPPVPVLSTPQPYCNASAA